MMNVYINVHHVLFISFQRSGCYKFVPRLPQATVPVPVVVVATAGTHRTQGFSYPRSHVVTVAAVVKRTENNLKRVSTVFRNTK